MRMTDRTVFIAGGTVKTGLEMARRFRDSGSTVVVGGRHPENVTEFETVFVDVTDRESVTRAAEQVLAAHPELDVVVTMAGVMLQQDLRDPAHTDDSETTIAVNVLGTIRVIDAFLPHLLEKGSGTIVTVSSGIGFVPFPLLPTYGASKAAVHAYSDNLRAQLEGSGIEVTELIPPALATTPEQKQINPAALDLDDFFDEVWPQLQQDPTPHEVLPEAARYMRTAERDGTYDELVERRSAPLKNLPGR